VRIKRGELIQNSGTKRGARGEKSNATSQISKKFVAELERNNVNAGGAVGGDHRAGPRGNKSCLLSHARPAVDKVNRRGVQNRRKILSKDQRSWERRVEKTH